MRSISLSVPLFVSVLIAAGGGPSAAPLRAAGVEPLVRIRQAIVGRDAAALRQALPDAIRSGGTKAMHALLGYTTAVQSDPRLYWTLVSAVASFGDPEALAVLGEYLVRHGKEPVARDVVYALLRSRQPGVVEALRPLLAEATPRDLQLEAAQKIGTVRTPAAVDALIELLKREEAASGDEPSALLWAAVDGLTQITGRKYGRNSVNWEGWWRKNRGVPLRGAPPPPGRTGTAVDLLDVERKKQFIGLEKAPAKGVIVLSADYTHDKKIGRNFNNDNIEFVLQRMGVPHEVVTRDRFLDYDLRGSGAILVNCAQFHRLCVCPTCRPDTTAAATNRLYPCKDCNRHVPFQTELSAAQIDKIRRFVLGGGYLFAEDWVVRELVERAFPRYVAAGPKLTEGEVDVVPASGLATHPYLKGIYTPELDWEEEAAAADPDPQGPDADADGGGEEEISDSELDRELGFDGGEAAAPEEKSGGEGGDEAGGGGKGPRGESDEKGSAGGGEPGTAPGKEGTGGTRDEPASGAETGGGGAPDPELLEVRHRWKIDNESFALKVLKKNAVTVLLESSALASQGEGDSAVALAFRPGGGPPPGRGARRGAAGVVVQVLSHFGKQSSQVDELALQNLLLNFLIDANAARREPPGRKKRGRSPVTPFRSDRRPRIPRS